MYLEFLCYLDLCYVSEIFESESWLDSMFPLLNTKFINYKIFVISETENRTKQGTAYKMRNSLI